MWAQRVSRLFTHTKDENISLIKREMYADVFQNILKVTAYKLSHSQAVKAEIMRSVLDAANHVVLYFANRWSRMSPDHHYNYGYGRFKNFAVMMPGVCFGLSGIYNIVYPLTELARGHLEIQGLSMTPLSLSAIILSSLGEFYVYYKNVGDVKSDLDITPLRRLRKRLALSYDIVMGKYKTDPIQTAIIIENVLAMIGVSMPILTSLLCFYTGLDWWDFVGEMLNGCVQIYLATLIIGDNSKILTGCSLGGQENVDLQNFILKWPQIAEVVKLHSIYLSSDAVKVFAAVRFCPEELTKRLVFILREDLESIEDPWLREKLEELLLELCKATLTLTSELSLHLESQIEQSYPLVQQFCFKRSPKNVNEQYRGRIPIFELPKYRGN